MHQALVAFRFLPLALLALLAACSGGGGREPRYIRPADVRPATLALDHVWIAVPRGGNRQREMLEAAGFRIAPEASRQDGQGTASARIAFENGHLDLVWADQEVAAGGNAAVTQLRFAERGIWQRSGQSPLGLGFRRTPATPSPLPFETWSHAAPWLGDAPLEVLTPRGSPAAVLFITPYPADAEANRAAIAAGGPAAEPFIHSNGARRLTGVRISAPTPAGLPPASSFVNMSGAAELIVGSEWLMELELDFGAQNQNLDFRPAMPLIVRF